MSSKHKNSNKGSNDLDIVSPFADILTEIIELLSELLVFLVNALVKWMSSYLGRKFLGLKFSNPVELKHLKSKKQAKYLDLLGYSANNKRFFPLSELNTSKHTAVIGSTGSGKSVCLRVLIDYALMSGSPVIYFDPKASLESIRVFKNMCQKRGKELHLFSDIAEGGVNFNPLLDGSIGDISDRIINALDWSEPFYKHESIGALDDVLEALFENNIPITFANIIHELKKHKNIKNIKGLLNQLSKVSNSSFGKYLNYEGQDTLTFNKLRAQNACLYIGISSMGFSSTGNILNKIFFGSLLTHAKDSLIGKVPGVLDPERKPISIVFDELSSTIHEGFIDLQNKCRQAGMEITYATQGPSDIDRINPTLTAQIFENTNNLFIFNQIVPAHTEFFARTFGTISTSKKTHVIENDQKLGMGTVREVEEFMVHSNILRGLRVGQCVLLQRSPKQVDLLNIRYWKEPEAPTNFQNNTSQASAIF